MTVAKDLLAAFADVQKRTHLVGTLKCGVIIALDMEGRLFTVLNGMVLNRVNRDAVSGQSTAQRYLNPGGDGLWPAPEGTAAGYQYSTGRWRPPPSLVSAKFLVAAKNPGSVTVESEIDLINNKGFGIPTIFRRRVEVIPGNNSVTVHSIESIRYIGSRILKRKDALLAPWSLCQFPSGENCDVIFPCISKSSVWDLYVEPSNSQRTWDKNICRTKTDGSMRYQVAMDKKVPWIEYRDPNKGLTVKRVAKLISGNQKYIDIRDASPETLPSVKGARYSVYSDPSQFMEIEAVGGSPDFLKPDTELKVSISTRYRLK